MVRFSYNPYIYYLCSNFTQILDMNRMETCLHNKLCMGLYGNFTGGEGSGSLKVPEIFSSFAEVKSGVP